MISRDVYQSAIEAAKLPMLATLTPVTGAVAPNIEVSKATQSSLSMFDILKAKTIGYKDFASRPAPIKGAVGAAADSLERRLTRVLETAPVHSHVDLEACTTEAHAAFDAAGFAPHDRFGLMGLGVWAAMMKHPAFAGAPAVWGPHSRLWGRMIWLRGRYLEVQTVMFCKSAVEGGIEAFEPSPGQAASAAVTARLADPRGARVLRWP